VDTTITKQKVAMTGGAAIVEAIRAADITHVFGLLGSSTMEVYDALYDVRDVNYIGVRDERAGTHMADAYGRVAGKPGVILAGQAGPGAANLLTGLAQARLAYSPLIAITGLASNDHLGRDAFQEIDQQAIFTPVTKRTFTVPKAERIPEFFYEAVRLANSGRRGPVVLNIPRDFFAANIEAQPRHVDPDGTIAAGTATEEQVELIRGLLRGAKAPVIVVGAGVKWGRGAANVLRLAEKLKVPIAASAGHPDIIPNDHPLYFGQIGPRGNAVASRLTREADVILALGTRLGFNTTFYTYNDLSPTAKIVHVDVDAAAIGRYFPIACGIIGDAGSVAARLAIELDKMCSNGLPWQEHTARACLDYEKLWQEREEAGQSEATPLKAERVFAELRRVLPRDAIVTIDAGTMCLQATDQLRFYASPGFISPLDFGLVGFSYAAGLGAKAAAPQRPVVTLMGDGGFAMTMAEITTAVQYGINTVAVVLDNGCWGAEKAYQRDFYDGRYIGSDIMSPPYNEVAKLCGALGYAVATPGELSEAVSAALAANRPAVIHVKVDPNAMVSFRRDSFKHKLSTEATSSR